MRRRPSISGSSGLQLLDIRGGKNNNNNNMLSFMQDLSPTTQAGVGLFVCYVALCRGLRYVRRNQRHARSPYKTREDFKKMTGEDAWEIVKYVQGMEFPWMTGKALSFALFR